MKPSRAEIERVGLGTAPSRLAASTIRHPSGCLVWRAPFKTGVPQIRMAVGGFVWTESAQVLAFRVHHGRWPTEAVGRSCRNKACMEPRHLVEMTMSEVSKLSEVTRLLTPAQVVLARQAAIGKVAALARSFGCSLSTVWRARVGRSYRGVVDAPPVLSSDNGARR